MAECEGTGDSGFRRVLRRKDVVVLAFGAMIGWGWVISTGDWISDGGVIGASIGFILGGLMIFFVGMTYAELVSAMPKCGGEKIYCQRAFNSTVSFICTWALILGYVSVVCFESCTIPMIFSYIYPEFLQGYLYTVEGYDIYATWVISAVAIAAAITYINCRGVRTAARLQTLFTLIICASGVLLAAASLFSGDPANISENAFSGSGGDAVIGVISVMIVTPFFLIGFDVIPQAAEEIDLPFATVGRVIILSIILAVAFYGMIILSVGSVMDESQIQASMTGNGLVTADAMAIALGNQAMSKIILVGGLCGVVTSWNSFLIGGSRALCAMSESGMMPAVFGKIHSRHGTPAAAIAFVGAISMIAPFFGRVTISWVVDAGTLGCCLAYFLVAASFMRLRTKEPDMPRPFKVRHPTFIGASAAFMSGLMVALYVIPGTGVSLSGIEWAIVTAWTAVGIIFWLISRRRRSAQRRQEE